MRVKLIVLVCMFLAGCGMTDDEVRAAKAECKNKGGEPIVMARLTGSIAEVRCF